MSARDSDYPGGPLAGVTRRSFVRGIAGAGIVIAGGPLLAACGSGSSGSSSSSGSPGSSSSSSSSATSATSAARKRGGTLTVGITGGGSQDTLDPHKGVDNIDACRSEQLFNSLVVLDTNAAVKYELAESISPNSTATEWTIKLKSGVTFHNGRPLTADDLLFTLNRILDPKAPLPGATSLGPVDVKKLVKVDDLTVRLSMLRPFATLVEQMASYYYFLGIVPVGFDPKAPIGTGPFVFKSFTPGQQSVFDRNPHYWKPGLPLLDSVVVSNFADETAMVNALVSKRANAIATVSAASLSSLTGHNDIQIVRSRSGSFQPFTMRVDQPPFNDVRVRQAFRLAVDRPSSSPRPWPARGSWATTSSVRSTPGSIRASSARTTRSRPRASSRRPATRTSRSISKRLRSILEPSRWPRSTRSRRPPQASR